MNVGTGLVAAEYPSGKTIGGRGTLHYGPFPGVDGWVLALDVEGGDVLVLDPRAVVRIDGLMKYNPRVNLDRLPRWAVEWLAENPEWGTGVAATTAEAAGAYPNGTRVVKVRCELRLDSGDQTAFGEKGTVIGSAATPGGGYFYAIRWDDKPGVATHCLGWKIAPAGGNS